MTIMTEPTTHQFDSHLETTKSSVVLEEAAASASSDSVVIEDLLVEDVSIDGMCGVY